MIDGTKKVLDLVKTIGLSLKDVMADGKVGWDDLPKMIPILAKVRPAVEGAQVMGKELGAMTDADIAELTGDVAEILAVYISAFQKPTSGPAPVQQL
jgi:hypothetical protein